MKTLRIALIGLALTFIAGCLTQERGYVAFSKLKTGMTEADLNKLLGAPTAVTTNADFVVWNYPTGEVIIRDGKVYSWHMEEPKPY